MRSRKVRDGFEVTGFTGPVCPLVYLSPEGRPELVSADSGRLLRWDVDSGRLAAYFQVPENAANDVLEIKSLVLPDGLVRIAAGDEFGFCLWDGESGLLLSDAVGGDRIYQVAAGVLNDGRALFVGAGVEGVHLWEPVGGRLLSSPLQHLGDVVAVALASLTDGRSLLVTGDYEGVRRWQGEFCEATFGAGIEAPHIDMLTTANLEDGRTLIVGVVEEGEAVCCWDAETGQEVRPPIFMEGEFVRIAVAAVSGRMRLFAAGDEVVRQWDLLSGEPVEEALPGSYVSAVSLPDGSALLATGTRDGKLTTRRLS